MSNPESGQRTGLQPTDAKLQAATGRGNQEISSGPSLFTTENAMRGTLLGLGIGALALSSAEVAAQEEVASAEIPGGVQLHDNFSTGRLNRRLWNTSAAAEAVDVATIDGNQALHVTGEQRDFVSVGLNGEVNGANVLETRIRIADVGDGNGVISLNLMSENPGHTSGYSALLSSEGGFLADRTGGFQVLESSQPGPFELGVNEWHTVRFELTNGELKLSVDGRVVLVADAEQRETGRPVMIFDSGMEVFIDDVRVGHSTSEAFISAPTSTPELTATPENSSELVAVGTVTTRGSINVRGSAVLEDNNVLFRSERNQTFTVVNVVTDGAPVEGNNTWYEIVLPEQEDAEPTATPTPSPTPTESPTRILRTARRGYVSATVVRFHPAPAATATPTETAQPTGTVTTTATPTVERTVIAQNPTATPTPTETITGQAPEGTQVAALIGNPNDELVMPFELAPYQTRLRFRSYMDRAFLNDAPWTSEYVTGTANWSNMDLLRGEGGERVGAGIYTDPETFPLDPALFRDRIYINGVEIEQALAIGQVVAIGRTSSENIMMRSIILYVAVPIEGSTQANVFSLSINGQTGRLLSIDAQGSYTGSPRAADQNGYIPRGTNPNSSFVWEGNNNSPFEFPAGNGEIVHVDVGTPIGVFFAMNPAEIGRTGQGDVQRSEGRNPTEWINDWQSGPVDQDDEVAVYQVGLVFPTNTTTAAGTP